MTVLTVVLCYDRWSHPRIIIVGVINPRWIVVILTVKNGEEACFTSGIFVPNYTKSSVSAKGDKNNIAVFGSICIKSRITTYFIPCLAS
jgi:hypothetical protein